MKRFFESLTPAQRRKHGVAVTSMKGDAIAYKASMLDLIQQQWLLVKMKKSIGGDALAPFAMCATIHTFERLLDRFIHAATARLGGQQHTFTPGFVADVIEMTIEDRARKVLSAPAVQDLWMCSLVLASRAKATLLYLELLHRFLWNHAYERLLPTSIARIHLHLRHLSMHCAWNIAIIKDVYGLVVKGRSPSQQLPKDALLFMIYMALRRSNDAVMAMQLYQMYLVLGRGLEQCMNQEQLSKVLLEGACTRLYAAPSMHLCTIYVLMLTRCGLNAHEVRRALGLRTT